MKVIVNRGEDEDATYDEFTEDSGVCINGDDVKQEFDFILFDLAEIVRADKETSVEWCQEVLGVIYNEY